MIISKETTYSTQFHLNGKKAVLKRNPSGSIDLRVLRTDLEGNPTQLEGSLFLESEVQARCVIEAIEAILEESSGSGASNGHS